MILGLTGFSGAGKSTVAALLKENGFYHLDCDQLVHEEIYQDPQVLSTLTETFGPQVVQDGRLNRPALRQKTMGDPEALKRLNDTVMPFILARIRQILGDRKDQPIVLDAPLLFESGLDRDCDKVLSVITSPKEALHRIMDRDHLTEEDAEKRLSSQHPADYYIQKSDYVLVNDGDLTVLAEKTAALLNALYDPAQ